MTWGTLAALAAATTLLIRPYCAASAALRPIAPGLVGARAAALPPRARALLDLASVPLLAALIVTQTIATGRDFTLDARVPALAVAALLVWRRAPFHLVGVAAAATAALLRLLT